MDFKGLSNFKGLKFPVNRKLMQEEIANKLNKKTKLDVEAEDFLTVVEINHRYLELVDRWYAHKGESIIYSIVTFIVGLMIFGVAISAVILSQERAAWIFTLVAIIFMAAPILVTGFYIFRLEAFKKTFYPVRLDRLDKRIYAITPSDGVIEADWDDLFIFLAEFRTSFSTAPTYEIRAHILDDIDRSTVLKTFAIASPPVGAKSDALSIWEFIRRYMEDDNGYKLNSNKIKICMPIKEKKETLGFSILRSTMIFTNSSIFQLIFSPLISLMIIVRRISIVTSSTPIWPEEIEERFKSIKYDSLSKTQDDNIALGFDNTTWPKICFVVGTVVLLVGVIYAVLIAANMFMSA